MHARVCVCIVYVRLAAHPSIFSNTFSMWLYLQAILNDAIDQRCCPLVVDWVVDINVVSITVHPFSARAVWQIRYIRYVCVCELYMYVTLAWWTFTGAVVMTWSINTWYRYMTTATHNLPLEIMWSMLVSNKLDVILESHLLISWETTKVLYKIQKVPGTGCRNPPCIIMWCFGLQ